MAKDDLFSRIGQAAKNRVQRVLNSTKLDENLIDAGRNLRYNVNQGVKNVTNPQVWKANAPVLKEYLSPTAILGKNQTRIGQLAQNKVSNRLAKNALDFSTRLPGAITQGLSFGTINPNKDLPAQTAGGMVGDFLGNVAGFGKSPATKAITTITNPIASKAVSKFSPALTPIAGTLAPRVGGAAANVLQGFVFDAAQRQLPTPTSVGLDIATGLLAGPNQFDDAFRANRIAPKKKVKADQLLTPDRRTLISSLYSLAQNGFKLPDGKLDIDAMKQIDDLHVEIFGKTKDATGRDARQKITDLLDAVEGFKLETRMRDSGQLNKAVQGVKQYIGQEFNIPRLDKSRKAELVIPKLGIADNQPKLKLKQDYDTIRTNVYNASANPKTLNNILTKNQQAIERFAKQDFDQWNRAVKQQETPRTLTGAVNDAVNAIKNNTKSAVSNPENLKDISPISSKFRDVYRNFERVFGDGYKQVKAQILDPFDKSKGDMVREQLQLLDNVENKIVNGLGIDKGSKLSGLVQLYGEGKITPNELKKQAGADYNKVIEADKFFRSEYDRLLNEVNAVRSKIYPNNPEKIIPRRKDYYRHFKEMAEGIEGLKNIFETPANISSELAGISYQTKPFTKWLSFAQKRTGDLTDVDAIGGYLDYIKAATYAKHIDPHTKVFRDLADELADSTLPDTKYPGKVNNFITFLSRYADDLAGKTNAGDRELQEAMGRRAFKVLNWVNNRVKANVIVGNASSSLAQIFNVPQGIANAGFRYAPINSVKTLKNMVLDKDSYSKSNFITERYQSSEFNRFDKGMLANTKKFAEWITGILDEYGTKYIWDMHYQKALKENLGDPIKYADDITRKMVAGRGVGEVPLGQKSKVFQLVAPFQLEVGNMWWIMKDWTDNKQFDKLAKFFVLTYVFNKGAEAVRGSGVAIDPIQAMVDSWGVITDEEDNKALRVGGRLSGEVLSNLPIGQTVAGAYPEYGFKVGGKQLPTREEFFGDADPTRFGSGLLAIKGFQDPIYKLGFPYGGQQIKRFIEGANAYQKGYSESPSGRVRFPIKQGVIPAVQSSVFGQYSTPQAREYFDKDRTTLGEKQSDKFKSLSPDEAQKYYQEVMDNREGTPKTSGSVFSVDKASASDSVVLPETEQGRAYLYNQDKKIIDNYEQDVIDTQYKTYADEDNRQKRLDELEQRYQGALARQEMFDKDYPQLSKDAEYESKATTGNYDDRYSLIKNELRQVFNPTSKKEVFDYLAQNQRKVNGKKLVTVPVLDDLYKEGIINKFERDLLKSVSFTKDGQIKFKLPTSSGSSRKRKVFTFKPSKINYTKLRINVPELPRIKTQFNTARLNTPVLPRVKLA